MVNGPYCKGCPWEDRGTIFIPPDGTGANRVMLLGDSGWVDESRTLRKLNGESVGTPFSGAAGNFIMRNLQRMGLSRRDFSIANSYWCKAPELGLTDKQSPDAVEAQQHCLHHLDEYIERMKPAVVVAQGNVALRRMTGQSGIQGLHSYILPSPYRIPVIPVYHPSYIMQGKQKYAGIWCYGIQRALDMVKGGVEVLQDLIGGDIHLLLDPSAPELHKYISDNLGTWAACDIETAGGEEEEDDEDEEEEREGPARSVSRSWQITRIGFALNNHSAFSVPWIEPYISICFNLWQRLEKVVFWNQAFDTSRLYKAGWGHHRQVLDGMWLWHWHESDLDKALEFVAPLMIPMRPWKHLSSQQPALYNALDNIVEYLCWERLEERVKAEGRLERFHFHCTRMISRLQRMADHGLLIDQEARSKFMDKLRAEGERLKEEIDKQVPEAVRQYKEWKREPKPSKAYPDLTGLREDGGKWILPLKFNPGSPSQTLALIKTLGLKVPKQRGRASTGAKKLRVLARRNRVFEQIRQYRETLKLVNGYNWPLDAEGRVHTEFGFHPSTWRKSSRNPNIQNIPKRNELAKEFRRMVCAREGYVLVEADSSAIEAVLVGYYARSESYIKLAKAGVHKWLAQEYAKRPVHKTEPLYDKIKRVVHLSNYLGTPQRIVDEYPDDFSSVKESAELQEFYFSTPAGQDVRRWQQETLVEASGTGHQLMTPFGQRHRFYNVMNYDGTLGEDAKRAVAFRPQASASAIQDIYVDAIEQEHGWMMDYLCALVHDSILAEVPLERAEEYAKTIIKVMTMAIKELDGLTIGVEVKIGRNLGEMEVVE